MTRSAAQPLWMFEFGEEYDVPPAIIDSLLADVSWHNDSCPSFRMEFRMDPASGDDHDLRLWVGHPDADQRDMAERFVVNYQPWSNAPVPGVTVCDDGDVYAGDDPEAALKAYGVAAELVTAELDRRADVVRQEDQAW